MTEELTVLFEVVQRLDALGTPYMLTGSMAANLYASPRMTRDLDLVVAISPDKVERLPEAFPQNCYYLSPEAARAAVAGTSCFNLIHLATMLKIDIMVRKTGEYRLLEFSRRQLHTVEGHPVWAVSKEDLILSKLEWARESLSDRQLADVRNLLATGCDQEYLQTWANHLQLTDILTQASA